LGEEFGWDGLANAIMFSGDEERERDKMLEGSGRGTNGGQSNPILAYGWPDICRQLQILMKWCLHRSWSLKGGVQEYTPIVQ
jgi:hypothetical protein